MYDPHAQFFTATILEWKHLLKQDKYKDIIVNSMSFLVAGKRAKIYGFVLIPNHIHLIWQINQTYKLEAVQRNFLKFTAQKIKTDLKNNHPQVLEKFLVNLKDRKYQLWEINPLSVDLFAEKVFLQKLNYIHQNPIQEKWKLADLPENYFYSSARFYETGERSFPFLSHYLDE
jgi:REP element-mobilizing transposase RayT